MFSQSILKVTWTKPPDHLHRSVLWNWMFAEWNNPFSIRPLYRWVSVLPEEAIIYVTVMSFYQWNIKKKYVWVYIYISSLCWYTYFSSSFHSFVLGFRKRKKNPTAPSQFCWAGPIYCSTSDSLAFGCAFNCFWAYGKLSSFHCLLKSGLFWPVIHHLLFLTLAGGAGSPGGPATPGRPSGEKAEWGKRGKKIHGRPFSFFRCWHQQLQRALQQGPGGSKGEREAATAR